MRKERKTTSLKLVPVLLTVFLFISINIFIAMGFLVQHQQLATAYDLAVETADFVKSECQKYDNYTRGLSARSMQDLLDQADGLKNFVDPEKLDDSDFLSSYIRSEHVGGILVLDSDLAPVSQADMDHQDSYELWHEVVAKSTIKNILQYPEKTYINDITLNNIAYDFAVTANADGSRLILCYASTDKPSSDPYELTLHTVLENNTFHKNPAVIIAEGMQILSTNSPVIEEVDEEQYSQMAASVAWKEGQLTEFRYQDQTWYGLHRVFGTYDIYIVYPWEEVFSNRTNYIAGAFMLYMGVCIILLAVQRHFDKIGLRKMEKQLRIINAISTSYDSTLLLHIDNLELEAIHLSARLQKVFEKHSNAYDFLFAICKGEVDSSYNAQVMHFLDLDTIGERLKGKPFLGTEVKDSHGAWYSVLLIPQKYDENGNLQAILITTRDVTAMKQAEELSFKDKLTGLHNRNYMESRSKSFVRPGDFPVSLIMVDCNYLKRTNDTLGHEYGDLLLQRIANCIQETIPREYVAMRVGGDEFLILCAQCSGEKARQLVDEMRKKLAERSDAKLTLSAAFGVSTTEGGEFNFERAYEAADREMYKDKQACHAAR